MDWTRNVGAALVIRIVNGLEDMEAIVIPLFTKAVGPERNVT